MRFITRTFYLILGIVLIWSSTGYSGTIAASAAEGKAFDAVFVLDTSYSMSTSDQNRISTEVITMFMDMAEASRTRIGFVAYNHRIVDTQPLTSIAVAKKKTELKERIHSLKRSGYTDMGLGLIQGAEILEAGNTVSTADSSNRMPFLILLSDGETDLGSTGNGRTKKDSDKDVQQAIAKAKQGEYPIYTIGLNHDGTVNQDELDQIASQTGGASYMTSSADDLPEIFNQIFARQMRSVLVPVAGLTATGGMQEVEVQIPNSSMEEANLILLSEHPIKEAQLFFNSTNTRLIKANKYSLMKITEPKAGKLVLKFKATAGDWIKINLLGSYNLEVQAHAADNPVKGQPTAVHAALASPGTSIELKDHAVYASLTAELVIQEDGQEEVRVPMTNTGSGFHVDHVFPRSGDYIWKVMIDGPDFYRESAYDNLSVTNTAPAVIGELQLELVKEDGSLQLDLKDTITDPNGDPLVYSLSHVSKELAAVDLTGSTLSVSPQRTGLTEITVTAADPEGAALNAIFKIKIQSKYTIYKIIGAAAALLIALGIALYLWLRPKPEFMGKLEGYFLNTASGHDIPVKSWPLTSFSGRRINLLQLFRSLDVNENLPESEHIIFEAGKNGTLLVSHNSRCALVRGRTPLQRNKKEVLQYNDKLYITFEDGITEIELRYKAVKPVTTIFTGSDRSQSA